MQSDVSLLTTQNITSSCGRNFLSRRNKNQTDLGKLSAVFLFPKVSSECSVCPVGLEEVDLSVSVRTGSTGLLISKGIGGQERWLEVKHRAGVCQVLKTPPPEMKRWGT